MPLSVLATKAQAEDRWGAAEATPWAGERRQDGVRARQRRKPRGAQGQS